MSDDVTRAFPHSVGPEKSLLSTMLQDPAEYIGLASELGLTAAHFYEPGTDYYTYAPSPGDFRQHLQHVKDKFALRSLLNFCEETKEACYDSPEEVQELLEESERKIMAIRDIDASEKPQTIRQAASIVLDKFQAELRHDQWIVRP